MRKLSLPASDVHSCVHPSHIWSQVKIITRALEDQRISSNIQAHKALRARSFKAFKTSSHILKSILKLTGNQ